MNARYSPVAPIALLENLFMKEVAHHKLILGNYLLLLAHDVLEHRQRYEDLILAIRKYHEKDNDTFIIMDNSVVELGKAMDIEDVIVAALIVEADCIMTPDVLGDAEATKQLIAEQASVLLSCGFPLMRVPQGKSYSEIADCVDWIRKYLPAGEGNPEYWGIPRWITNELGTRISTIIHIGARGEIHLLGTSNNHEDDCHSCTAPNVMGIDSANPLVMGYAGFSIRKHGWKHMQRGNYWDISRVDPVAVSNIHYMRHEVTY